MFYEVIPEGKTEELTYSCDSSLLPGQIVMVPVGRRTVPGVVVKKVAQPDFKTKAILKVLYSKPLPPHLLAAVRFVHEYYLAPSGTALSLVLPRGVQKQRRKRKTEQMFGEFRRSECSSRDTLKAGRPSLWSREKHSRTPILLNTAQKNALQGLQQAAGATKLLFGVTGSGKTNVYLEMAARAQLAQKSTILLVPEIALTGQLVQVFQEVFRIEWW
ncbi:MAG: DEAD/DEAH box helicase family protein [Candidatus Saccharibacteria bacterium]|nr:DEAD/DEAH box helicase family protein [Candidatus Saccharibacteria bacterium]